MCQLTKLDFNLNHEYHTVCRLFDAVRALTVFKISLRLGHFFFICRRKHSIEPLRKHFWTAHWKPLKVAGSKNKIFSKITIITNLPEIFQGPYNLVPGGY